MTVIDTKRSLTIDDKEYDYYSLPEASRVLGDISRLPFSLKVLMENLLRHLGNNVEISDLQAMVDWQKRKRISREIAYRPARVLMQDFTGVPAVVDLAAMRDAIHALGGDPKQVNPLSPVDLVIDHSVMVDSFGGPEAFGQNVAIEFKRNRERYEFLRWGQEAFANFRVVPPGTGICHQVNTEYLAQTIWTKEVNGRTLAFPDTCVGTDSHTTMVNGLAVLGWGVGGIEAEASMLGQPVSMLIPEVIGFKLQGALKEGTTTTDLVLTITQMLRARGVVGKFVEFFGSGLDNLTLPERATIANMAPEYGATCGFFPIDVETCRYLRFTGRDVARVRLVEAYAKAQGMWRDANSPEPLFTDILELDLAQVEPSIAGPKRPQDRVVLGNASAAYRNLLTIHETDRGKLSSKTDHSLKNGDVVIAAITSCTNTSNPSVLIAAGLVARKAREKGLMRKPWVKTSLAPGSQVVSDYLEKSGLQDDLNALGFNLVGYGCTTCIGNSGPLPEEIAEAISQNNLHVVSVLSGNRNFEGRVHPQVRANYLASPPLVVAYALLGTMMTDITREAIGTDSAGQPVYLADIWPSSQEIKDVMAACLSREMFVERYADVFKGTQDWHNIPASSGVTYEWNEGSTYVQNPPYFKGMSLIPEAIKPIEKARILALFDDSITTDHISPAGVIKRESPAGHYLLERQVLPHDFNSYGARRGNHQIMMRGTFANIRIRNKMLEGIEGGYTCHQPSGEKMDIYTAAMRYAEEGISLVVIAGREYGTGSSRDWAAKGTRLLGVKAVIAQSFERIHRSNLVGMGVLPLQFQEGEDKESLGLDGSELVSLVGIDGDIRPQQAVTLLVERQDGSQVKTQLLCRIDTTNEAEYYRHGGILNFVLRNMARAV